METPRHNKSKEEIQMEMKMKEVQAIAEKNLNEILIPAIAKKSKNLLEAGKVLQNLSQAVNGAIQAKVSSFKFKDLELPEGFEDLDEMTLADFNQASQWFGQIANKFAENKAMSFPIEECFTSLKESEHGKE